MVEALLYTHGRNALVDIPEEDLSLLNRLSRPGQVSRAELVRSAIRSYLEPHRAGDGDAAFGIWCGQAEDGLAMQERLREEW